MTRHATKLGRAIAENRRLTEALEVRRESDATLRRALAAQEARASAAEAEVRRLQTRLDATRHRARAQVHEELRVAFAQDRDRGRLRSVPDPPDDAA